MLQLHAAVAAGNWEPRAGQCLPRTFSKFCSTASSVICCKARQIERTGASACNKQGAAINCNAHVMLEPPVSSQAVKKRTMQEMCIVIVYLQAGATCGSQRAFPHAACRYMAGHEHSRSTHHAVPVLSHRLGNVLLAARGVHALHLVLLSVLPQRLDLRARRQVGPRSGCASGECASIVSMAQPH